MLSNTLLKKVLNHIETYANGREVVMFGMQPELQQAIREHGHITDKIFTSNPTLISDEIQHHINYIQMNGQKDKYYVVVPFLLEGNNSWQKQTLSGFGYTEKEDYIFYPNETLVLNNLNGKISDGSGNTVEGRCRNISVKISGSNNSVVLKDGVQVNGSLNIVVNGTKHKILIGEKCVFNGTNHINVVLGKETDIKIENCCEFSTNTIRASDKTKIEIGEKTTFFSGTQIYGHANSRIIIGKDCMFSFGIVVQPGDGHTIFDLETNKSVNFNTDASGNKFYGEIELKDHVWVSRNAMIISGIKNTVIGEGSIIGAGSIVKGVFPNNCSIAGVPAKVLRKNLAWSRIPFSDNIEDCKGYTRLTEEISDNKSLSTSKRIESLEKEVERLYALLKEK